MITGPRAVAGQRYRLDRPTTSVGAAQRYEATDEKLARPVLAWVIEAPEGSPDRDRLLSLARTIARTPAAAFLRILDVAPEPDRLAVVVEAPPASPVPFSGQDAAEVALDIAASLAEGTGAGLQPARLNTEVVFARSSGPLRLDPVGVFLAGSDEAPVSMAWLLARFLESLTADANDRAAQRLRVLAEDWRSGLADGRRPDELVEELRLVAGNTSTASWEIPPAPVSSHARFDEEDTLEMEPYAPPPAPPTTVGVASPPAPARSDPSGATPVAAAGRAPTAAVPPPRPPSSPPSRTAEGTGWRRWRRPALRADVLVPAIAAVFVVALGTWGLFFADESPTQQAARSSSSGELRPPVEAPSGNGVTIGLAAQEDSTVRVTVDGVVEFDGMLRAGQRQLWEGRQRIQVRTENGQTLLLSVNGEDLGPYSPAMGHPDWDRIDFGFWPGWEQDEVFGQGRRE